MNFSTFYMQRTRRYFFDIVVDVLNNIGELQGVKKDYNAYMNTVVTVVSLSTEK